MDGDKNSRIYRFLIFMDSGTRSKVGLVMGVVILVMDLLWLYGSVFHYGGYSGILYRNFTHGANSTYPGFSGNFTGRTGGYTGYLNIAYGLVILVADIVWLYLTITVPKPAAKRK